MIRAGVRRLFHLALHRRDRWEREVEDEITLHLALRAEQLADQGLPPDAATNEAVRRFGPLAASRARLLDAARHREHRRRRTEFLTDLRQDLRFALRTLGRRRGWTAVTILTLALGIGATTAVFSVVSSLLLHPLPYPHADRMVFVYQEPAAGNKTGIQVTITPNDAAVRTWMHAARSFEALEGYRAGPVTLQTAGEPLRYQSAQVFPSFPRFAGVRPIVGRMFTAQDVASRAHVVLLGEQLWRSRYGAQRNVVGTGVTLDDTTYTIIGVLPAALRSPLVGDTPPDFWLPLDVSDDNAGMMLLGLLRPGVHMDAAARELDSLVARSNATGSASASDASLPFRTILAPPASRVRFRDSLTLLSGAVLLVLLIACANVAHLLLARTAAREHELSLRAALGAGRWRLFRQLLTESLLLTTSGAALGVLIGWAGLRALIALRPPSLDELRVAHLDTSTLLAAAGVTAACALLFGLMGALQSASNGRSVRASTRTSPGRRSERVRGALVVTEMALSALLIVGATMLVRSVSRLQHADLGFQPQGLYTLTVDLPEARYATPASRMAFVTELTQQLGQLGTLGEITVASNAPRTMSFLIGRLEVEGEPVPPASATSFVETNAVQPNYFRTLGIRMVQGSAFTDTTPAARQVIINEGFARKHWGAASALGHHLRVAQNDSSQWYTVVGVAADAQTNGAMTEATAPMLYMPFDGAHAARTPEIIVRPRAGTAAPIARVRSLVHDIDPHVTATTENVADRTAEAIAAPRYAMLMLTVFTVLALVLAAIGLYGVMAYAVAQRTHEIGIRIALGAPRGAVGRAVIRRGLTLAVAGAALGLAAAHWGTRLIAHELYGMAQTDPLSFVAAVVVLLGAAVLACVVPTRRALAVDPLTAIRAE